MARPFSSSFIESMRSDRAGSSKSPLTSRSILVGNRKQPLVVRIDQSDLLALVDALFSAVRICTGVRPGRRTSARTTFVRKPSAYDGLASSHSLAWGQHDSRNDYYKSKGKRRPRKTRMAPPCSDKVLHSQGRKKKLHRQATERLRPFRGPWSERRASTTSIPAQLRPRFRQPASFRIQTCQTNLLAAPAKPECQAARSSNPFRRRSIRLLGLPG